MNSAEFVLRDRGLTNEAQGELSYLQMILGLQSKRQTDLLALKTAADALVTELAEVEGGETALGMAEGLQSTLSGLTTETYANPYRQVLHSLAAFTDSYARRTIAARFGTKTS